MGQMIFVNEDEYNEYRGKAKYFELLATELEQAADSLYPEMPYWTDTGNCFDVAEAQLMEMRWELERKRRPWKKKIKDALI